MKTTASKNSVGSNLAVMLGFGVLSVFLGFLKFTIPGLEGSGSDMREIGVLLSIFFLPEWFYMLGVSFIASLSFPFGHLEVSTILMHCTAGIFGWFAYTSFNKRIKNVYLLSGVWSVTVLIYYTIFLIPTLVIVLYLYNAITGNEILSSYKNIFFAYRFEIFASASVTSLFIALYKTSRILEIKNHEIEEALAKSQESDRLKTAFINNINHEVRTSLNGIIGFTNLIVEPGLEDEKRIEYSKVIIASSNRLLSTILNIIEISRLKTEQVKLKFEVFDLNELLDEIYQQYFKVAEEKNLTFIIERSEEIRNEKINSDRKSLRQVLVSFIDNAIKFTREGSVIVSISKNGSRIFFAFKDTGPGIEPEFHEKIFDSFSRIENQNEEYIPGSGLGLSISKALAELLGGEIQIKSDAGKGSIFIFSVPVNQN